jgi:hypothetical protein
MSIGHTSASACCPLGCTDCPQRGGTVSSGQQGLSTRTGLFSCGDFLTCDSDERGM